MPSRRFGHLSERERAKDGQTHPDDSPEHTKALAGHARRQAQCRYPLRTARPWWKKASARAARVDAQVGLALAVLQIVRGNRNHRVVVR